MIRLSYTGHKGAGDRALNLSVAVGKAFFGLVADLARLFWHLRR